MSKIITSYFKAVEKGKTSIVYGVLWLRYIGAFMTRIPYYRAHHIPKGQNLHPAKHLVIVLPTFNILLFFSLRLLFMFTIIVF